MVTLVKQLDEKSKDVLKQFQMDHPINQVVGQHPNQENKRVMHRLFRLLEEFGPEWSVFYSKVLEFNITDEEKEVFRSLAEYFSKESIANVVDRKSVVSSISIFHSVD